MDDRALEISAFAGQVDAMTFDGSGQSDVEAYREQSQRHHDDDDQHVEQHFRAHVEPAVAYAAPYQHGQDAADERRHSIEVFVSNNHWHVANEDVTNEAAGQCCEHAKEYGCHA